MSKTIVIVDDDQDDLDLMKQAVKEIDPALFCISFIYPEEALRVISRQLSEIPDYVFIDINMPGMTGDKLLKEIRKQKTLDNVIVTLYSTSMPAEVAEALISLGANHTFEKPVRLKSYIEIIADILRG